LLAKLEAVATKERQQVEERLATSEAMMCSVLVATIRGMMGVKHNGWAVMSRSNFVGWLNVEI